MKASQQERPPGRSRPRARKKGQPHPPPPRLTPDQAQAADRIHAGLAQGEPTVVLCGSAGTGKTFTVTDLLKGYLNWRPRVVTAPTHKAVHVLRGRGLLSIPPALCYATLHCRQGSTYDIAYLDLTDIGRNTKWYEIAKLLYVGLTRPRHAVLATGTLPERLYTPRLDPLAGEEEALEPLAADNTDRREDSATGVDAGAGASRPYLAMQPDHNLPPEVQNRHG